jgi:hypothetical protein
MSLVVSFAQVLRLWRKRCQPKHSSSATSPRAIADGLTNLAFVDEIEVKLRRVVHDGLRARIEDPLIRLQYADLMDLHKIIDKNWDSFRDRFESRDALKSHLLALKHYRNPLGHARDLDVVEQKQGEAAIVWLRRAVSRSNDSSAAPQIEEKEAGISEDNKNLGDEKEMIGNDEFTPEHNSKSLNSVVDDAPVDDEFGIYKPLFDQDGAYLTLLNLGEGTRSKEAISLIMRCSDSVSDPYPDIRRLLVQNNWRPHLVAAVAIATRRHNSMAIDQLWATIDRGSWVAPQLVAVAFLSDSNFVNHAEERLRTRRGSIERSGKALAALVRLIEVLPNAPDSIKKAASDPILVESLKNDRESPGGIAEEWLQNLRQKMIDLGASLLNSPELGFA